MQVVPVFSAGGAETMCVNLSISLKQLGNEVLVVSLYSKHTYLSQHLEDDGIQVFYLDKHAGFDVNTVKKLTKLVKKEKPDVIHSHLYASRYATTAAMLGGVQKRIQTIHTIAQKETTTSGKIINSFFFSHCHLVPVALSDEVQQSIQQVYSLPKEKIPVINNGIHLQQCLPKTDYSLKNKITILHIGRFAEPKNHKMLVKAFSEVSHSHPNVILQLIGDGKLMGEIKEEVDVLGIKNRVEFLGLQANVFNFLHGADIFILPSVYEGMPMTLIEAMGSGLPIIASNVGGIPDMLTDSYSGLLIDPTVENITRSINLLLTNDELREKIGKNALKESVRFSDINMAENYLSLYEGNL
jgi:glycosyltransferase involved in cell wall biosynthesis